MSGGHGWTTEELEVLLHKPTPSVAPLDLADMSMAAYVYSCGFCWPPFEHNVPHSGGCSF